MLLRSDRKAPLPKPVGVIDTSCVIALDALALLPQLSYLFASLLIPKAVREELYDQRSTKDRIQALLRDYHFVHRCDDYDRSAVDVLLTHRRSKPKKNRGEIEAVVQAAQLGAMVVVDESSGRKLAASYQLEYHGTIWILERLCELALLTPATVRRHLARLKERDIRLPWKAANELLERLGERAV